MVSTRMRTTTGILLGWMATVAVVMMSIRIINIEIFFVLWMIGAIILTEVFSLQTVRPQWRRIQLIILGCSMTVFIGIVVMKIAVILIT